LTEAQEYNYAAQNQLAHDWEMTQEHWGDSTTDYFRDHFYDTLMIAAVDYLRHLDDLAQTLAEARVVAQKRM